ncbi:HyaD/HybD family hydrogenase maturation endopeptidase [Skermanella sp. TT6]|uniref:HyaD/HybD family hydrogenase maturation endopeptidase n=1 Tax=Skermanella cutis TaxID=2775420 RepID=A0ABX7BBU1_9PROT|nr:HyaD/HybD family hydrogenase maturation endopeptidase [Skermanella sp. TT6]QQP91050.1 HyaD/HybD family hydrogenase maturation endopeptidase [Skermanella sp. TT6]
MSIETGRPVLVLGIGNILWADEGFGVRCVEELHRRWSFPDDVLVMDGGTQGLYLVHYVKAARRVIVFDAIDYGEEPGTLRLVRGEEVPKFTGAKKMSLHQTGFQDVLSAAELLGGTLDDILLIGVQAVELDDYGGSLTPPVRARIEPALAIAVEQLERWGYPATPRTAAPDHLLHGGIGLADYEAGRPSAEDACRVGDSRFFA